MNGARTARVAVIGGGLAAAAAAIAFRRALPDAKVTLFTNDRRPEYAGAADPYIHDFHAMVGIDPREFERRTGAVTVSEAEFRLPGKAPFRFVRFDEMAYFEGVALHQLWLRLTERDASAGPAWNDVARRARRQDDLHGGLGVRFDAVAYLAMLGECAERIGVTTADAVDAAGIVDAFDLVVDTESTGTREWAGIDGIPGGFAWQAGPGSGDTGSGGTGHETIELSGSHAVWANASWKAEGRIAEGAPAAGRAVAPFDGKLLAVGRAALRCETFDGRPLSTALAGIARAIELLPRPGASGREAAEYNRRMGIVHEFLLDWAVERSGGMGPVSPTLEILRAQFGHRGRIPMRDEDPVPSGQWLGWLLGCGQRPRNIDLTARAISDEQLARLFAGF